MGALSLPAAWQLYLKNHRIATFTNWPFLEDCACTPERMAEAGFVHCPTDNEPDLAQCFFCFKELEGWEPDDDPLQEHRRHSAHCAFLSVKKQLEELTLSEFLKLDKERAKNKIVGEGGRQQAEGVQGRCPESPRGHRAAGLGGVSRLLAGRAAPPVLGQQRLWRAAVAF
ncbi:PREDICTED: baculoviral IAP repeat-containing protein 5 isoform X1 [Condylura cristata]|uniref:baculoviral IAP repeat-containing protein 5 isoform X1 n=1 Tax=Condylura cristata TaxID=143302 RepID=UPI00064395EB|nr:PREDICTED: baculoviral IAP repeat-containing protein 5 isoform X1 [Condylura cristata]